MDNQSSTSSGFSVGRDLMKSAHVIVNPLARRGRHNKSIKRLLSDNASKEVFWRVRFCMSRGHAKRLAAEAVREKAPMIIAAGGDGTLHEIVNGLMAFEPERRPVLAVLPLGTGNDFAKMLDMPPGAIEGNLSAIRDGSIHSVDVGQAGDNWFINDMGIGLVARATQAYHAMPRFVPGAARYIAAVLQAAVKNPSHNLRLWKGDDLCFNGRVSMAAVSNGIWTGGQFPLNPLAEINDGLLNVCLAHELNRREVIASLPSLMRGEHLDRSTVESFDAKELWLESEDSEVYQLDGELYPFPKDGLEIKVVPDALRIVFARPPSQRPGSSAG